MARVIIPQVGTLVVLRPTSLQFYAIVMAVNYNARTFEDADGITHDFHELLPDQGRDLNYVESALDRVELLLKYVKLDSKFHAEHLEEPWDEGDTGRLASLRSVLALSGILDSDGVVKNSYRLAWAECLELHHQAWAAKKRAEAPKQYAVR
jgi:hypothetical protein